MNKWPRQWRKVSAKQQEYYGIGVTGIAIPEAALKKSRLDWFISATDGTKTWVKKLRNKNSR
ncbi:MAG: hypothetical protein ACLR13_06340 [Acutalibacteraceae bacterium]